MSRKHPVRSSQLIAPYGVGAMITLNGIIFIVAGLDAWFLAEGLSRRTSRPDETADEQEFVIRERRLEERLQVSGFRRPPDYREPRSGSAAAVPNAGLTIPVLRYPQWHFCAGCGVMQFLPLTEKGKVYCSGCAAKGVFAELTQMPFVAICERGHLQDFPWSPWVHRQHQPSCTGDLRYVHTGGGTLAGQKIVCTACGKSRSLLNIDKANLSDTYLSFNLAESKELYLCKAHRPWLGITTDGRCSAYLRGNQRGAGNVWFGLTANAINLPDDAKRRTDGLVKFLTGREVAAKIDSVGKIAHEKLVELLKIFYSAQLAEFTEAEIAAALPAGKLSGGGDSHQAAGSGTGPGAEESGKAPKATGEIAETAFRHPEFLVLRENQASELLITRRVKLVSSAALIPSCFSRLVQVPCLRETRVFTGFARVNSGNALPLEERKAMLRRPLPPGNAIDNQPAESFADWLPATTVNGEGIFLEFNEQRLIDWETRHGSALQRYLAPIETAFKKSRRGGNGSGSADSNGSSSSSADQSPVGAAPGENVGEKISARFILLHSFTHLLIKELVFESGYSSAALRERLYVSKNKATPMAGVLIYTADGDSEGTLGGLVRMGTADNLERLIKRALEKARWCASDPVCREIGTSCGQGPENCNLAACHTCALLPETSCEEFNCFLDRGLLVTLTDSEIEGFFEGF